MTILTYILAFLVAIGILVAVHEYGHFWMARRMGIKVLRFSIGFGRVASAKRKWRAWYGKKRPRLRRPCGNGFM